MYDFPIIVLSFKCAMAFYDCYFPAKTPEGNLKDPLYLHYEQGMNLQVVFHPDQPRFGEEPIRKCELYPEPNEFFRQDKYGNMVQTKQELRE